MAEILGTVASGLQMAGILVKLTTIGFQLHTLYREMQGVPAEVVASLVDVQVIAQILDELNKSPMAAPAVFRTARSRCEKHLQELQATLRKWDTKMRSSRGFSRRLVCLGFILHKNDIAKMEHRLETCIRLLLFATQMTMLASHERLE